MLLSSYQECNSANTVMYLFMAKLRHAFCFRRQSYNVLTDVYVHTSEQITCKSDHDMLS